jgi:hypothetical protein
MKPDKMKKKFTPKYPYLKVSPEKVDGRTNGR